MKTIGSKRRERVKSATREHLRVHALESYALYQPGVGGVIFPMTVDLIIQGMLRVTIKEGSSPLLDERTLQIVHQRTPQPAVNNPMPAVYPISNRDSEVANLTMYLSTYQLWRGTLPRNDGFDTELKQSHLNLPFNTTSLVVTSDGFFITPCRTNQRASH